MNGALNGSGEGNLGVVADRYELLEVVGRGGMGVVYRARDRVLDRLVALKTIHGELADDDFVRRFEREASILARVRSPYTLVVYDYGQEADRFYLVTDFLADGDLAQKLEEDGPFTPAEAAELCAKLAEGLADAHAHGVIHRDIKPGNVLIWRRGDQLHPVLADFGIAVAADVSVTATKGVIGTPMFMAPERHLGQPATPVTDIYAMGCLLYNLVTGQAPYGGNSYQVANAHLHDDVPTVPAELPGASGLNAVIAACMAKDPAERIPSATELANRLRALATPAAAPPSMTPSAVAAPGAPTTVVRPPTAPVALAAPDTREARRRRTPLLAVLGVLLVVGTVATAGALWMSRDEPSDSAAPSKEESSVDALPVPPEVEARARPGYRKVVFSVVPPAPLPDAEVVVERKTGRTWAESPTKFEVETVMGGMEACAVLRLAAVRDGERVAGPVRKVCRASRKPVILLTRGADGCSYEGAFIGSCQYFDAVIEGLRPQTTYRVIMEGLGEPKPQPKSSDQNGRISLAAGSHGAQYWLGGIKVPTQVTELTISVMGSPRLSRTFELAKVK